VLTLLRGQLRLIAHRQLAGEAEGHTLETSGLVSEAYLRLLGVRHIKWHDTQHLLAMAARSMRRVLVDYAENRNARKRGGAVVGSEIDPSNVLAPSSMSWHLR